VALERENDNGTLTKKEVNLAYGLVDFSREL
jgi:hypothetical protein